MATFAEPRTLPLAHFTADGSEKSLLRISTAGSVDDGKSTLIGRLLYDSKAVWDDHIEDVRKSRVNRSGKELDLSLLTDGLRAEREQGITIDVAYRYFATPRRKFIVADTPGHEQYTRNMATGASTADLAILLVDARKGLLEQSRRHAFVAWLLGVRKLVFAINKMDLVEYRQEVFEGIRRQADPLLAVLEGAHAEFLPVSALEGDNVTERSANTPWYGGPTLLDLLESAEPPSPLDALPFRFPVQLAIRPHLDFRGYAGQIASGRVRVGDEIVALPSGRRSRVARIVTFDGDLDEAFAPMSVTLVLEDEIDLSRGDLLAPAGESPKLVRGATATLVWMHEQKLEPGSSWLLQAGPRIVPVRVRSIDYRWDVEHLRTHPAESLELNAIGRAELELAEPVALDNYRENRIAGAFILIDPIGNRTVAAGLMEGESKASHQERTRYSTAPFTPSERAAVRALLAHMEKFGVALNPADFEEGEGI